MNLPKVKMLQVSKYQCWEAIVVNDGSPDETEKVALEYTWKDSRIKYVFTVSYTHLNSSSWVL